MEHTAAELLELLQIQGENQRIEAKASKRRLGNSVQETIAAFSNEPGLGGGYLVLGLHCPEDPLDEDDRYLLQGVENPDEVQQQLAGVCRNTFNVQVCPEITVEVVEGKTLVIAYIPEVLPRDKPVFIKKLGVDKGSYRRIGSADYRCTERDLDLLFQLRSGLPYESEVPPYSSMEDIDLEAIAEYRFRRKELDANAQELRLSDEDLLIALGCGMRKNGEVLPTVAGIVLFGTKAALRRLMPTDARVDYIVADGSTWVENPSSRYYSIDYREALVLLMPRLHAQIMGDLPSRFSLKTGDLQRTDIPCIPKDVVREALSNALMHRDYRAGQPTQIIRYANRLEFKNGGYSLKPFEELGEAGSKQRNLIISAVFHELKYAETKGTGIGSMQEWMREAGLTTPPIIETDRESNEFDLVLLSHHLLDRKALEWLAHFRDFNLSDAQRRSLVFTQEVGAITNQDYRQLNGIDTLHASASLRDLRDQGLLIQKGKGNKTYYILAPNLEEEAPQISSPDKGGPPQTSPPDKGGAPRISSPDKGGAPRISSPDKGGAPRISSPDKSGAPQVSSSDRGLSALPKEFPEIPKPLKEQIQSLGKRVSKQGDIKKIIKNLCKLAPLTNLELAKVLGRTPDHVRELYLSEMVKSKELEYTHPENLVHPQQAYKSKDH